MLLVLALYRLLPKYAEPHISVSRIGSSHVKRYCRVSLNCYLQMRYKFRVDFDCEYSLQCTQIHNNMLYVVVHVTYAFMY